MENHQDWTGSDKKGEDKEVTEETKYLISELTFIQKIKELDFQRIDLFNDLEDRL